MRQPVHRYYSVYDIYSPIPHHLFISINLVVSSLYLSIKTNYRKMSRRLATIPSLLLTFLLFTPTLCATLIQDNLTDVPTLSLPIPVPNPEASKPPAQYGCAKRSFFRSYRQPSWYECTRAIALLPDTHDSGTFHTTGYNDQWRLPRTETFRRCRAQVEIENRSRAPSSWAAVRSALADLGIKCRKAISVERAERTGGWMFTGPEGRIKVSLLGPDDPASPNLESNGTSNLESNWTSTE